VALGSGCGHRDHLVSDPRAASLMWRLYHMALPPTAGNDASCPVCGHRPATVLTDQWTRIFLRCPRCEHVWVQEKPDADD